MAYLFVIENNVAKPNVETLLISPFKEIWERDKSKDKEIAIKEFSYIEFITSMKKSNPFAGYSEEVKSSKILEYLNINKKIEEDELVKKAILLIEEFNTNASPNYLLYKDSIETVEKTRKYLKNIDLDERTKSGMPVHKASDIFSAIEKGDKVAQTMNSLKEKVIQDIYDNTKLKGGKIISQLEI